MNLPKNEKEIQKLKEWAAEYGKPEYLSQFYEIESYFTPFDSKKNIQDYAPTSFPDFCKELDDLWENDMAMQSIIRCCAIAAMKNRPNPVSDDKHSRSLDQEDFELPAFVYVF